MKGPYQYIKNLSSKRKVMIMSGGLKLEPEDMKDLIKLAAEGFAMEPVSVNKVILARLLIGYMDLEREVQRLNDV